MQRCRACVLTAARERETLLHLTSPLKTHTQTLLETSPELSCHNVCSDADYEGPNGMHMDCGTQGSDKLRQVSRVYEAVMQEMMEMSAVQCCSCGCHQ